MPRVIEKRANRGATKTKRCEARVCAVGGPGRDRRIVAGESYFTWSFRYGGTHYQHKACGYPRPSQLTQSMMAEVYDAIEAAEGELALLTWEDYGKDAAEILEPVAEVARDVASRYAEAAEPFGGQGENQDRADALESFADELESVTVDDWEEPDEGDEDAPTLEDAAQEWIDNFTATLEEAMSNLSV